MEFSREEVSHIEKNLGFIVFDWAKHLISNVLDQARKRGVSKVYMNTPQTIDSGNTSSDKLTYFYEKLPPIMGFNKEKVNLRGRDEELWAFDLNPKAQEVAASFLRSFIKTATKTFTLEQIPKKYQGAMLGIIGKKPEYTLEEAQKVLSIIEKKEGKREKAIPKYFYDWESKTWSGSQRFTDNVNEMAVLQKIPQEMQNKIIEDDILRKFWSYMLSQYQHFGPDVIGFALVSPVSQDSWVINEIQTDCINAWNDVRRVDKGRDKEERENIDWDTLVDMLTAQNRTKWIAKLEMNEGLKQQIMGNPGMIGQLPDDNQDVDAWIANQMAEQRDQGVGVEGLNLAGCFDGADFSRRVYRLG